MPVFLVHFRWAQAMPDGTTVRSLPSTRVVDAPDELAAGQAVRTILATESAMQAKYAASVQALKQIHDEADHILGTDAPDRLAVALTNAETIRQVARDQIVRLESEHIALPSASSTIFFDRVERLSPHS